jgi:hypothetical protein
MHAAYLPHASLRPGGIDKNQAQNTDDLGKYAKLSHTETPYMIWF